MALNNSLAKATQQKSDLVKYNSNGEDVQISKSMIRAHLVSGDKDRVTDSEITMFLSLCKFSHLNPFIREAYLIKYGNNPATMVVGKDVLLKRAMRSEKFGGLSAGVIVVNVGGKLEEREGSFVIDGETLVGGWAKVIIKGYDVPFYSAVSMKEYSTGKSNWQSKPATMIRKVAVAQALREAFPEETTALYDATEMDKTIADTTGKEIVLDETPVEMPAEPIDKSKVIEPTPEVAKPVQGNVGSQAGIEDIMFPESLGGNGKSDLPFEL